MKKEHLATELQMIPIDQIEVLNPRERNARTFEEIVGNIKDIGLKKPITVTRRPRAGGVPHYLLVCGEGRLKAYKAHGEREIPALVVNVNDEDAFIMSLTENIARRQGRALELLSGIDELRIRGYDKKAISQKTGLNPEYVQGLMYLLENGEERLLMAVKAGKIPINTAMTIAGAGNDDKAIQSALQTAYESGTLRGRQLIQARQIVERRRTVGRTVGHGDSKKKTESSSGITSTSLVRSYQREVQRQKMLIKKAGLTQQRLLFVVEALRQLLADENFSNLLRAEGLETLPKNLADRVWLGGHAA